MTKRNSPALLSPFELAVLRRIADGRRMDADGGHLRVLLAMGLAGLDINGWAARTTDGQQRLRGAHEDHATR
jgi:hypothetical protein